MILAIENKNTLRGTWTYRGRSHYAEGRYHERQYRLYDENRKRMEKNEVDMLIEKTGQIIFPSAISSPVLYPSCSYKKNA